MRLKQLRGLPVIDPVTARKIGSVLDYQIDPLSGRLAALDVGQLGSADDDDQRILADRVRRVGRSAVILTGSASATPKAPHTIDDRWIDAESLVGLDVIGDDGNRVGSLADASFDQDTLAIEFYVLKSNALLRLIPRRGRVLPSRIQSCSRELMLVTTGRMKDLPAPGADDSAPSLPVPLKVDDRLPAPRIEAASESQPVGAQTS